MSGHRPWRELFGRKERSVPPVHPVLLEELEVNGKVEPIETFYYHAKNIALRDWSTSAEQGLAMTVVALVDRMIEEDARE